MFWLKGVSELCSLQLALKVHNLHPLQGAVQHPQWVVLAFPGHHFKPMKNLFLSICESCHGAVETVPKQLHFPQCSWALGFCDSC